MDAFDLELRQAALSRVRELQRRFDDLVPVQALRQGFQHRGQRVSFGSFYSGIFRPREMKGAAALCLVTAPPKVGRPAPYEDEFDESTGRFTYRFRDPASPTGAAKRQADADNRALLAAHREAVPLIYFRGILPGQYSAVAPIFVTAVNDELRLVEFEAGLPLADTTPEGLVSPIDDRRYATREAVYRLHQHRFRAAVLRAYGTRCAVCALREAVLLQAAHIVSDRDAGGVATVINGISLCAIHHLAYDRNLLGIDPEGVVHISKRLLGETDGPMLRQGSPGVPRRGDPQARSPRRAPRPGTSGTPVRPLSRCCLRIIEPATAEGESVEDLATELQTAAARAELDHADLARVFETSPRTVARWLARTTAPHPEARERLLELLAVLEHISQVLAPQPAHDWLFTPNPRLDHYKPVDLLRAGRAREVLGALDAMAEGVFA